MNMRKIGVLGVIAGSFIFSSPALYADDDTGLYLGLGVSRLSADFEDENDVDFDDSDNTASARIGYMFTPQFGVELGYVDLGDYQAVGSTSGNRIDIDADAFSLALVVNWTLADQLDLYVKGAAYNIRANSNSTIAGSRLSRDDDETEAFGAIGVDYDFGGLNLFAEFSKADTDTNDLSIDIVTAGVKFEFGPSF